MAIIWDYEATDREIKGCISKVTKGAIKGVVDGASVIEADVKRKAPVDTDQYRSTIRSDPPIVTEDNVTVVLGSPRPQACRLEWGFVGEDKLGRMYHQAPRPHWRPAFDLNKEKVHDIIAAEIRKEKGE